MTRFSSPLPSDEITFPEILRAQAGYFTGVCGRSYHLDGSNPANAQTTARLLTEHGLRTFAQRVDYLRTGSDAAAPLPISDVLRKSLRDQFFMGMCG